MSSHHTNAQPRVRFLRPGFFIWLIVPLVLYAGYAAYGLPHLRWSYSWRDDGQGYDPFANRFYLRCTYLGVGREFTIHHPPRGACPLIRFAKSHKRDRANQWRVQ